MDFHRPGTVIRDLRVTTLTQYCAFYIKWVFFSDKVLQTHFFWDFLTLAPTFIVRPASFWKKRSFHSRHPPTHPPAKSSLVLFDFRHKTAWTPPTPLICPKCPYIWYCKTSIFRARLLFANGRPKFLRACIFREWAKSSDDRRCQTPEKQTKYTKKGLKR